MKFNKDLAIKLGGLALTVAGTIVTAISSTNENKEVLKKLVEENLKENK